MDIELVTYPKLYAVIELPKGQILISEFISNLH